METTPFNSVRSPNYCSIKMITGEILRGIMGNTDIATTNNKIQFLALWTQKSIMLLSIKNIVWIKNDEIS